MMTLFLVSRKKMLRMRHAMMRYLIPIAVLFLSTEVFGGMSREELEQMGFKAIKNYAATLGIPRKYGKKYEFIEDILVKDPPSASVDSPGKAPPSPSHPWVVRRADDTGKKYYWNRETGATQWNKPAELGGVTPGPPPGCPQGMPPGPPPGGPPRKVPIPPSGGGGAPQPPLRTRLRRNNFPGAKRPDLGTSGTAAQPVVKQEPGKGTGRKKGNLDLAARYGLNISQLKNHGKNPPRPPRGAEKAVRPDAPAPAQPDRPAPAPQDAALNRPLMRTGRKRRGRKKLRKNGLGNLPTDEGGNGRRRRLASSPVMRRLQAEGDRARDLDEKHALGA